MQIQQTIIGALCVKPEDNASWLEERKKGIGSSDIATLIGVNKWSTPYQLWLEKTGRSAGKAETALMRQGHSLELAVADLFARETGAVIDPQSEGDWLYRDLQHPHRQASPDRLFTLPVAHETQGETQQSFGKTEQLQTMILECKSTQLRIDPDNIPDYWFAQLQWQLGIAGLRRGAVAWLSCGRDFGYAFFDFNADFFALLAKAADDFWQQHILLDVPPEATTSGELLLAFPTSRPEGVIAGSDEEAAYARLLSIKSEIATLEAEADACRATLQRAMGSAELIRDRRGQLLATWRTSKPRVTFDSKRLAEEQPEIYAQYLKEGKASRTFLLK